jgi:hypothetical protein
LCFEIINYHTYTSASTGRVPKELKLSETEKFSENQSKLFLLGIDRGVGFSHGL